MEKRKTEPTPQCKQKRQKQKRHRCLCLGLGSPASGLDPEKRFHQAAPTRVSFTPSHAFRWYDVDMWTEIAKHLCGFDLIDLSQTCHWFRSLMCNQDSIWQYAFYRDLGLTVPDRHTPRPLYRSWRVLYLTIFRRERYSGASWRIGGFLVDTQTVLLTGKLPFQQPQDDIIKMTDACMLNNARLGVWVADVKSVDCPGCAIEDCKGGAQVLEARHSELFLDKAYLNKTLKYEDLSEHCADEEVPTASCAIFCSQRLDSVLSGCLLNTKSWFRDHQDLVARTRGTMYGAAVNSNLPRNKGLLTRFEAMRDTATDGQTIAIRISQSLL